jgi:hypothetical protein
LPVRRPAVAAALVAAFEIAPATVALAAIALAVALEFVAAALVVAVPALAFKPLAPLTFLARRCAIGRSRSGFRRCALAGLSKFLVAAAAAVMLALCTLAGFAGSGGRLRAALAALMAMTAAVMTGTALFGAATGTPDFDQFRRGRRFRCGWRGRAICRCSFGRRDSLRRGLSSSLWRGFSYRFSDGLLLRPGFCRRFGSGLGLCFSSFRLRLRFNRGRRLFARGRRQRDFGQQRGGRRGIAGNL